MGNDSYKKKIDGILILLGFALIVELAWLFFNSGMVKGLNRRADNLRVYAIETQNDETILPGDVFDRNGRMLVNSVFENINGNKQMVTTYSNGMAYAQVLGYTGRQMLDPLAKKTEDVASYRRDARLLAFLDEDYWGKDGALYHPVNVDGVKGQNATLTIDDDLQNYVYSTLCKYMSTSDDIGSAVVMDVNTGEILADVSFPTYDFNNMEQAYQDMVRAEKEKNVEPAYPVTYKNPQAPGSIFKVLTAVALIDHGEADYTVPNSSFTMKEGWTCKANEYSSNTLRVAKGQELNMETALNISSNVYFSKAFMKLGEEKVNETAEKFMLTNGNQDISLDFGNVKYNWDTHVPMDIFAQTGFGQGRTEITTIHAAMITQAIANDGKMMKPYMVKQLTNANGKVVYRGKEKVLSKSTSKKTANIVTSYMRSTANECCSLHNLNREKAIFNQYEVAGKTGTAENGDEEKTTNAWYISFAPASKPKYVVVVNRCKTPHKQGYSVIPAVADIYDYLFTEFEEK